MLNFYRKLIKFRKGHPLLLKGSFEIIKADEGFIAFERRHGNDRVFCAFNLCNAPRDVAMPNGVWKIDASAPFDAVSNDQAPRVGAWQALFAVKMDFEGMG